MKEKISSKEPVKAVISRKKATIGLGFLCINLILTILLLAAGFILSYYFITLICESLRQKIFSVELIKTSIYIIIGAYFFLIVDRNKIKEILGIKDKPYLN